MPTTYTAVIWSCSRHSPQTACPALCTVPCPCGVSFSAHPGSVISRAPAPGCRPAPLSLNDWQAHQAGIIIRLGTEYFHSLLNTKSSPQIAFNHKRKNCNCSMEKPGGYHLNQIIKVNLTQTSLAGQWLRLCTSTAEGPCSIPGWGIKRPHALQLGFPGGAGVENLSASAGDAGDAGSIPELQRSPRGNGNPLQYSCLENPMDR